MNCSKSSALPGFDQFESQAFEHLVQQRQHPAPLVELFGRQFVRRLDLIPRFARVEIQRQLGLSPATFLRARPFPLVGEEVLESREQERAKTPPIAIGLGDRPFFEQVGEEGLRQVLRLVDVVDTSTDVRIQRIPIVLAKLRERGSAILPVGIAGGEHDAPLRGGEVPFSPCWFCGAAIFGAMFVAP